MHHWRILAAATYGEVVRRPLYLILLAVCAAAVYFSKLLTLFTFYQEIQMVREMGLATLTFWGFVVLAVASGVVVTQELDDRTAVTLLAKPLRRRDFLLGKFAGMAAALAPGMFVLAGVLFITLLQMSLPHLEIGDADLARQASAGHGPFAAAWNALWKGFVLREGGVVLEGAFLCFLQGIVLAALAAGLAAFLPHPVSAAALTLLFVLGNLSSTMVASLERMKVGPLTVLARAAAYLLPNFGYFNLQTCFSEGRIISIGYLGSATAYAALYAGAALFLACSLFRRREVR